jgi:glycosyltransferase involved in cell wall biosynthesis
MNIALIHYTSPPVVGGVESVLGHQARLMADAGYQVSILAGRGAQLDVRIPFVQIPLADSRHPDILAVKAVLDAGFLPKQFAVLVKKLKDILHKELVDTDVLIAHNICSLGKNLPLTAAIKELSENPGSPRLILWHHDLAWTTPRYRAELHEGYPWDLLSTAWPGSTQVVVSELRRKELAKLQGVSLEEITVIPNGVDLPKFLKLDPNTIQFVKHLELQHAAPILLLPVRITPRKNIEMALQVLAALREKFPQAALVVTGPLGAHNPANVKYYQSLVALREELGLTRVVHFLAEMTDEYLPDSVIADFYRVADALFLPSREEGFGIPILEAGLAGLPIFCSDISPLRALGGDSVTYFSYSADPSGIAMLIFDRLSQNPIFNLRVRVRQKFTWEGVFDEFILPLLG